MSSTPGMTSLPSTSTPVAASSSPVVMPFIPVQGQSSSSRAMVPIGQLTPGQVINLNMASLHNLSIGLDLGSVGSAKPSKSTSADKNEASSSGKAQKEFCQYLHRYCLQEKVEGFNYCKRHILQDKTAPFKQCTYIHRPSGKRCPNVERRQMNEHNFLFYCSEHNKKFNLLSFKSQLMESVTQSGSVALCPGQALKRRFSELEHFCPNEWHDHRRPNFDWTMAKDMNLVVPSRSLKRKVHNSLLEVQNKIDIEEDCAKLTMDEVFNHHADTDFEGPESYMENPLRHASTYAPEEVAHILRDKMLRLQTLYINHLGYFRELLKHRMVEYLLEANKDQNNDDKLLSKAVAKLPHLDPVKEEEDLKLLKAMQKYHNIKGKERLAKEKAAELKFMAREKIEDKPGTSAQTAPGSKPPKPTCIFPIDEKDTCAAVCLPLSNYCLKHILYDEKQVLFRPCAAGPSNELPCPNPVISYIHKNTCFLHADIRQSREEVENIQINPVKNDICPDIGDNVLPLTNDSELFPPMDVLDLTPFDDLGQVEMLG